MSCHCLFLIPAASNEKSSPPDASARSPQDTEETPSEADAQKTAAKGEAPPEKTVLSDKEKGLAEEVAKLQEARKETHNTGKFSQLRRSMGGMMQNLKSGGKMRSLLSFSDEDTDYKEKYLRALAEVENTRQRLTRQINDAKQFGIQSFVKDLLEVSDILTRAMGSVPDEALSSTQNVHLKNLFEGLRLTEAQMMKVFTKHGLERIDAMGSKFDPNIHEALFEAPADKGQEPGTVMAVTQTGFKLHNRTVRPARVGVVKSA